MKNIKNPFPDVNPLNIEYSCLLLQIRNQITPGKELPQIETDFFITSDSTKLFVRRWYTSHEKLKGIILCFHGMGGDGEYYVLLADQLVSYGFDVIVYDHYGHGLSSGTRGDIDHFSRHYQYAYEMICHIADRYPNLPLYLLAESMGGTILINTLINFTNFPKVTGILLFAPGVKFQTTAISLKDILKGIISIVLAVFKPGLLSIRLRSPNMQNLKNGVPIMDPLHFEYDQTHPWHWDYVSVRFLNQLRNAFKIALTTGPEGIKTPLILFYGLNDIGIDHIGIIKFYESISYPDKKLIEIPEAPHAMFTHITFQPYWNFIRDWLLNKQD